MSVVLLARHGRTASNRELRFQGRLDVPLDERGRRQAAELAERVRGEGVRAIWSSPLRRAHETAAIVAAAVGIDDVRLDDRLQEIDVGEAGGRRYEEVRDAMPDVYAGWRRPTEDWRFPGGESVPEQQARVLSALEDVRRGETPALVVCHGGVIRCALMHAHRRPIADYHAFEVDNCALVRL